MSQQILKIRPTKIEYIKLRKRLALATRVQKIMKEKLSILTLEFLQVTKLTVEAKIKLLKEFSDAGKALSIATGYHGSRLLEKELLSPEDKMHISIGSRSIAGVKIPSFELEAAEKSSSGYNMAETSSLLDHAAEKYRNSLESVAELAELQRSLELLGMEIKRTRRIVNAMEFSVIPTLRATIRFLYMKFEERDREEKSRLKRVKAILERK
jgi:V/A-type H+/Na+-transporting ATPase subunit D